MLNQNGTGLAVISDFRPDRDLPKYVRLDGEKRRRNQLTIDPTSFTVASPISMAEFEVSDGHGERPLVRLRRIERLRWWTRFWRWLLSLVGKTQDAQVWKMSVLEFFLQVKSSAQDINLIKERAQGYEQAILNAQEAGQTALLERLRDGLHAYRMETLMCSLGINRYVSETTVVEFYKKARRGLRLDLLKNFTRPIPKDLATLKRRADELEIFDNYAVLHYDPGAKSYAETKAEKASRKDPILFGLLQGRSDLYVIGDWVDEVCDLTLDEMAEILGRTATEEVRDTIPA